MSKQRVGLILPSVNIHMEPEFYRLQNMLPNIDYYATRVFLTDTTEETLVQMEQGLEQAASLIATVYPSVVVYACTSGSFIKGPQWDEMIMAKIRKICNCPAITASRAMVNALQALNIRKLTLVTPYTDDINEHEKSFLESLGIKVVAMRGLNIVDAENLRTRSEKEIMDLVLQTDVPEAEGVFISCTNVEGMYIADSLEKQLGKPVLSSNSASLWSLLRLLEYQQPLMGYGTLLASLGKI